MKHVFTIHSPITFLAAHCTIKTIGLDLKDVIILSNRYQINSSEYNVYPFPEEKEVSFIQKVLSINALNTFDEYISTIVGEESFIAYIDIGSFVRRSLISHKKCKSFNFIEEGNSSYREGEDLDTSTWDWANKGYKLRTNGASEYFKNIFQSLKWASRGYTMRFHSLPYSFKAYRDFEEIKYYGFSSEAYPGIYDFQRVVMSLSSEDKEVKRMALDIKLSDSIIWVDGASTRFTKQPEQIYHKAIQAGVVKLNNLFNSKKVYLKLRPGIDDYTDNFLFRELKKNKIEVEVLPDSIVLESLFVNSDNCIVIGNLSSALMYASIFGHKSYSIYSLYTKRVATIFDKMPAYWNLVEKL